MYQEWFELFNKIKEEGKKQCMEGDWESETYSKLFWRKRQYSYAT